MGKPPREPLTDLPIFHAPGWKVFRNIIRVSYHRMGEVDRKGRPLFRLEVKKVAPTIGRARLLNYTTTCPACGKDVHPFRERVRFASIYFSLTHAMRENPGCSRGNASTEAHDLVRMAVEQWQQLTPQQLPEAANRMVPFDDDDTEGYLINEEDWE